MDHLILKNDTDRNQTRIQADTLWGAISNPTNRVGASMPYLAQPTRSNLANMEMMLPSLRAHVSFHSPYLDDGFFVHFYEMFMQCMENVSTVEFLKFVSFLRRELPGVLERIRICPGLEVNDDTNKVEYSLGAAQLKGRVRAEGKNVMKQNAFTPREEHVCQNNITPLKCDTREGHIIQLESSQKQDTITTIYFDYPNDTSSGAVQETSSSLSLTNSSTERTDVRFNINRMNVIDLILQSSINGKYNAFVETHLFSYSDKKKVHSSDAIVFEPSILDILQVKRKVFIFATCNWTNEILLAKGYYYFRISASARHTFEKSRYSKRLSFMYSDLNPEYSSNEYVRKSNLPSTIPLVQVLLMRDMDEFLAKNLMEKEIIENEQDLNQFVQQEGNIKEFAALLRSKGVDWIFVSHRRTIPKKIEYIFAEHGIVISQVSEYELQNLSLVLNIKCYSIDELLLSFDSCETFGSVDQVDFFMDSNQQIASFYVKRSERSIATLKISGITKSLTSFCQSELTRLLKEINLLKCQNFLPPMPTILGCFIEYFQLNTQDEHSLCVELFSTLCQDIVIYHAQDTLSEKYEIYEKWANGLDWMLLEATIRLTT